MLRHLTADVHCHWNDVTPSYRVYVDNDLLTERTFGWPGYQVFVRENMICELEKGLHTIRVENCNEHGTFKIYNLTIEGHGAFIHPNYIDPDNQIITFIVEQ